MQQYSYHKISISFLFFLTLFLPFAVRKTRPLPYVFTQSSVSSPKKISTIMLLYLQTVIYSYFFIIFVSRAIPAAFLDSLICLFCCAYNSYLAASANRCMYSFGHTTSGAFIHQYFSPPAHSLADEFAC